jgi:hypothetical protein
MSAELNRVPLVEGEDFYWEGAVMVFTARYLARRGYCCENGCRHCPYDFKKKKEREDEVVERSETR